MGNINIALCCSPLQVIIAAAAIELNSENNNSNEKILCIYHNNIDECIDSIIKIGKALNFDMIFDFTSEAKEIVELQSKLFRSWKIEHGLKKAEKIELICEKMKRKLNISTGHVKELYCRKPRATEAVFANKVLNLKEYKMIEDGFSDNLEGDKTKPIIWRRCMRELKRLIIIKTLSLRNIPYDYMPHLINENFYQLSSYTISELSNSISVIEPLKRLLAKINNNNYILNNMQVILLGTIGNDKLLKQLINEYIIIINEIIKTRKISTENIVFRPHPRMSKPEISKLKNKLPCMIDDSQLPIAECLFSYPNLEAVYSHHSTGTINAKRIFNIDAYFIDSSLAKNNRKTWSDTVKIAKKFDIPFFVV